MNNERESTYRLLVRSEEKSRGIVETMVYALLALSVIVSIWQFARQSNALPIDQVTWRGMWLRTCRVSRSKRVHTEDLEPVLSGGTPDS